MWIAQTTKHQMNSLEKERMLGTSLDCSKKFLEVWITNKTWRLGIYSTYPVTNKIKIKILWTLPMQCLKPFLTSRFFLKSNFVLGWTPSYPVCCPQKSLGSGFCLLSPQDGYCLTVRMSSHLHGTLMSTKCLIISQLTLIHLYEKDQSQLIKVEIIFPPVSSWTAGGNA